MNFTSESRGISVDKCEICGTQNPDNPSLIWIDRALSICVCDDCHTNLGSKYFCPKCGTMLFIETDPDLRKEYPYVCISCDENMYSFEVVSKGE